MATTMVVLSSCYEEEPAPKTEEQPAQAVQPQPEPEPVKPVEPTANDVLPSITEQLVDFGFITTGELGMEITPNPDESFTVAINLPATVKENLYTSQNAPEHFNEQRKAINESAAAAMLPESCYLMQVGAPTDIITDEDRTATPLPENLQALANELKELAESAVYVVTTASGTSINITGSLKAKNNDGSWEISDLVLDTSALLEMAQYTPETALPAEAAVMTAEFEQNRKNTIDEKIAAFNAEATPYIKGREDTARARLVEAKARHEEDARKAEEQAQASLTEKEAWVNHCIANIADGKLFSGEWTRGERFGALSIQIDTVVKFDDSLQFVGKLFDTKLPEACLDIDGRCQLTKNESGTSEIIVILYDGQYDPDQPTAEVFDAKDGMLKLALAEDGKISGIMTCSSWQDSPDKEFKINLAPSSSGTEKKDDKKQ